MRCPYCKSVRTRVIDSRLVRGGEEIRRRRECEEDESECGRRFTTFERVERNMPIVVKRGDGRVPYDRDKVRNGILRASWKRNLEEEEIEQFLNFLERRFAEQLKKEITTRDIGQEVLKFLKARDPVAYVRFASVYGDFQSVEEFQELLSHLDEPA